VSGPLVTIGMPVYRGQDVLPVTLECIRAQSYQNLDVLISVDADDQSSAQACEPFLRLDPRFRMQIQPSRLGWAGNTDWTMRERRGDFYIYQQHDDQVSPTYVADLVAAAIRSPGSVICFAKMQCSGLLSVTQYGVQLSGSPLDRIRDYLETLDCVPFRGLMRGSALARTSGLLLSDSDPFDSYGTENRLMAELALQGDFQFVPGPTYYKHMHGSNFNLKREKWSKQQKLLAWACLAAWMMEVVVPAGRDLDERRTLFDSVLDRFLVAKDNPWKRLIPVARRLALTEAKALQPVRAFVHRLKQNKRIATSVAGRWLLPESSDPASRATLLCLIFDRLKSAGRFDPSCLRSSWESLEEEANRRFVGRESASRESAL
jgi:glycosyltransferase involved in cell wall biosynthesis